jgi:hypothetical protein
VRADLTVDQRLATAFPEFVQTFMHEAMTALRDKVEEWATGMWLATEEAHRHLLRMQEAPTIDTYVDGGASFTERNDLRVCVEIDPPTFWCELPADHPARG